MPTVDLTPAQLEILLQALASVPGEEAAALRSLLADAAGAVITTTCVVCGREFAQPRMGKRAIYCSRTCNQRAYRQRAREAKKQFGPPKR